MKILVGKKNTSPAAVEGVVQNTIISAMVDRTFAVTPERLARLAVRLEMAANEEALQLFQAIAGVIDRGRDNFSAIQIGNPKDANPGGVVRWDKLSDRYALWKARRGLAAKRGQRTRTGSTRRYVQQGAGFYTLTGDLHRYFDRNSSSIVLNRFGGVRIRVQRDQLKHSTTRGKGTTAARVELGRLQVQIFPRVDSSLMPMLASRRWDKVGETQLERESLPPRVADKLSGGRYGPVRPLVTPTVQFFILHRIPNAIARELRKATRDTLRTRSTRDF